MATYIHITVELKESLKRSDAEHLGRWIVSEILRDEYVDPRPNIVGLDAWVDTVDYE